MAAATVTYRPDDDRVTIDDLAAVLTQAGFVIAPPRRSTLAVLDTFDGRIRAAGMQLELRDGRELVLRGNGTVPARISTADQPRVAADIPPGPLRQRLADILDVRALLRLIEVSSQRTTAVQRNRAGKMTATVAIHERPVADGAAVATLVAEADELAGYPRQAAEVREILEASGLRLVDGGLADLAAIVAGVRLDGYSVSPGVRLDPALPALDGFRKVLANLRDAIVVNWDGTVNDIDPEFLHDLRVGVRRTRSVLANAKRVIPEEVRQWAREEFRWFGDITGPVRDLDVYQIEWPTYTLGLDDDATKALEPLRLHLAGQQHDAHEELSAHLSGERAADVVDRWSRWVDGPSAPDADERRSKQPIGKVVARRIRRAHTTMVERGRDITPATPAEVVHELRKDAKKLRYVIECFGGLYDKSSRTAFVKRLKSLQDVLGEHQDAEVHAQHLRSLAAASSMEWAPETMLAIGQLIERMERRRLASRAEVEDRFASFDRPKTQGALDDLLASADKHS